MQHTLVTSSSSVRVAPFTQAGRNSHRPPFAYCQLYSSQACQSPIRQPQQQQQQQTPATKQQHHDVPAPASAVAAAAAAAAVLLCWQAPAAQALPDTQLQQIKQTIDQDFQQGQVSCVGLHQYACASSTQEWVWSVSICAGLRMAPLMTLLSLSLLPAFLLPLLQYYVTGNLSKDLYAPDCRFKDPTTDVKGDICQTCSRGVDRS